MYVDALGNTIKESGGGQNWLKVLVGGLTTVGSILNDVVDASSSSIVAGGLGDDTYTLWGNGAKLIEKAGEGIDSVHVQFWGGYQLADNFENLYLDSPWATWGTGNALDNLLVAGTHGATLDGGAGNDVLVGGAGADVFRVAAGNGSDTIYNFQSGWDTIELKNYGFQSFADVMANATQIGSDVSIGMSNGEQLVLRGVDLSTLVGADFGFSTVGASTSPTTFTKLTSTTTMTGVARCFVTNGVAVLNNMWGTTGLTYGSDYAIDSNFNSKNLTSGTTFNWALPNYTDVYPQVRAYPEIIFGKSPLGDANVTDTGHAFPVQLGDIQGLTSSFDTAIGGTKSGFNVAYDIWFTNVPNGDVSSITNEVMVWTHKGAFEASGTLIGTFSNGGLTGKIYHSGTYTALVLDQDVPAGTIDLGALFKTLQGLGVLSSSEYLGSVQFGSEVASGTGSLTINKFNMTLTTGDGAGGTVVKQIDGTGTTVVNNPAKPTTKVTADMAAVYDATGLLTGYTTADTDGTGAARTKHFDTAGNLTGSDVVSKAGSTTTTRFYDASGKITGTNVNTGKTTVFRNAAFSATAIDVTSVSGGITTVTHYTGKRVLLGIDQISSSNGVMTKHFDAKLAFTGADLTTSYSPGTSVTWHYDKNWQTVATEQTSAVNGVVTTTRTDGSNVMLSGAKDWVDANGIGIHQDFDKNWALQGSAYTGTTGDDTINLGSGINEVHDGLGSDTIVAAGGQDTIVFDSALGKGVDTIKNFSAAQDVFELDQSIFAGIPDAGTLGGTLIDKLFTVGSKASGTATRIIYNSATGDLFYDPDGTKSKAAVLVAHLDPGLALTASNFHVG